MFGLFEENPESRFNGETPEIRKLQKEASDSAQMALFIFAVGFMVILLVAESLQSVARGYTNILWSLYCIFFFIVLCRQFIKQRHNDKKIKILRDCREE